MKSSRLGTGPRAPIFAVIAGLLLSVPMLAGADGLRDASTIAAADVHDPCFDLNRSTGVAELRSLGFRDVNLPNRLYEDYEPGAMDCFSDLLLGRIEALSITFRDRGGGPAVVVLIPRAEASPERLAEWKDFLTREYGGEGGLGLLERDGLFLMTRPNIDIASLEIGPVTSFWQEVIER